MAAAVAAEVPEAMAEVDDADDELGDEYDEIELDDEEAAQRVAYEVDQVGEDNDGDDDDDAGAEKDEAFEVDTSDSDDSGGHCHSCSAPSWPFSLSHPLCRPQRTRRSGTVSRSRKETTAAMTKPTLARMLSTRRRRRYVLRATTPRAVLVH